MGCGWVVGFPPQPPTGRDVQRCKGQPCQQELPAATGSELLIMKMYRWAIAAHSGLAFSIAKTIGSQQALWRIPRPYLSLPPPNPLWPFLFFFLFEKWDHCCCALQLRLGTLELGCVQESPTRRSRERGGVLHCKMINF